MQYVNRPFGAAKDPYLYSPYVENTEIGGGIPPPPPTDCLLVDQAGDFIITHGDNSNVLVHCQLDAYQVIDYQANRVVDFNNNRIVAVGV